MQSRMVGAAQRDLELVEPTGIAVLDPFSRRPSRKSYRERQSERIYVAQPQEAYRRNRQIDRRATPNQ
jgi:hypothetical protein